MKNNLSTTHERIQSDRVVKTVTNRKFGLSVGAVLLGIGLLPLIRHRTFSLIPLSIGLLLVLSGVVFPKLLSPLHRLWIKIASVMQCVIPPAVFGFIFIVLITPIAFVLRILKKDLLKRQWDKGAESYWILKNDSRMIAENFKNQF